MSRVFARIFVIISIFAFSADFHDFLENKLATPSLGESGERAIIGRPKVGLGIYIYSCHAGELFGFVPVARDEQAFSC